eukprot:RCo004703
MASDEEHNIKVFLTAKDTENRLTLQPGSSPFLACDQPTEFEVSVFVDPGQVFQTVLGFGGAFTDASAETYFKLPEARQQELVNAYFSVEKGLGYTLGRIPIH